MSNCIKEYQEQFAARLGARHAFAFWKGRVAMYAILKAMGIGGGDEVILPGYTCVMDVNPIKYIGASPVYVDIEPKTFNLDTTLLAEKITGRTKVIIAQHTYGYACNMDALMKIAREKSITVIEDCCLALAGEYRGRLLGSFGKAAYFSMQWNKPFTTGLGGMAITDDLDLAAKIETLCRDGRCMPKANEILMLAGQLAIYRACIYPRTTALAQSTFRYLTKKGAVVGSSSMCEFVPIMAKDFFKGLSNVQAHSGLRQMTKLERNVEHRRTMADRYDDLLAQKGWISREYDCAMMNPVMVRYPVRIKEKEQALQQAARRR